MLFGLILSHSLLPVGKSMVLLSPLDSKTLCRAASGAECHIGFDQPKLGLPAEQQHG